jgi:PhnB protein
MSIRAATPYLILNGRGERAVALYTRALGAKTEALTRFGEADEHCPAASKSGC